MLAFQFEGEDPLSRSSSSSRDVDFESGRDVSSAETPAGVLQDIALKCGTKVMVIDLYCIRKLLIMFMIYVLPNIFLFFFFPFFIIGGIQASHGC